MLNTEDALFPLADAGPQKVVPELGEKLSPGQRRTIKRLQLLALGQHPITRLPLHPDAPVDGTRFVRKIRPVTCGSCVHHFSAWGGKRTWPKCDMVPLSHSAASDAPAWFPGCMSYRPIDNVTQPVVE